jgi:CheY-like chemotaxis protein
MLFLAKERSIPSLRAMHLGKLRLWVVEDEASEHFLVRRAVSRLKRPVDLRLIDHARRAMESLQCASAEEIPHVIVCDLKMPHMDGFEFLAWLRQSPWRVLPLVICSNSEVAKDITRAYSLGANAYHVKASTTEAMEECFNVLIDYWGECCRTPDFKHSSMTEA